MSAPRRPPPQRTAQWPARLSPAGFTLIELMICVAVLGICLGVGWRALATLRSSAAAERHALRVTIALESEMDRLGAAAADDRPLPASGAFDDPGLAGVPGAVARRELRPLGKALIRVALSARWRTTTGQTRRAGLVSLLRRRAR